MLEIEVSLFSEMTKVWKGRGSVAIDQFKKLSQTEATPLQTTCGVWLYGPPGVGKSHKARYDMGYTPD